jgi:hypothetical protein
MQGMTCQLEGTVFRYLSAGADRLRPFLCGRMKHDQGVRDRFPFEEHPPFHGDQPFPISVAACHNPRSDDARDNHDGEKNFGPHRTLLSVLFDQPGSRQE